MSYYDLMAILTHIAHRHQRFAAELLPRCLADRLTISKLLHNGEWTASCSSLFCTHFLIVFIAPVFCITSGSIHILVVQYTHTTCFSSVSVAVTALDTPQHP